MPLQHACTNYLSRYNLYCTRGWGGLPGTDGLDGPTGNKGPQGPTGDDNLFPGPTGDVGSTGPVGAPGEPGQKGERGVTGYSGPVTVRCVPFLPCDFPMCILNITRRITEHTQHGVHSK